MVSGNDSLDLFYLNESFQDDVSSKQNSNFLMSLLIRKITQTFQ